MIKKIFFFFVVLSTGLLMSCGHEEHAAPATTVSVANVPLQQALHYPGILAPLNTRVLTSPVDGTITEMTYRYGDFVAKEAVLFKLTSEKFSSDYKAALTQYIKAKNEYNTAQTQMTESRFLYKNGLIAEDDFKLKQSNFYSSRLSLVQAQDALELLLKQLNIKKVVDLYNLSITDFDKIMEALHLSEKSTSLQIVAPVAGVFLAASKNEDDVKKIFKGDAVKQGVPLGLIGDVSGFTIPIKVSELVINQLKCGQKVTVTGVAFPDITLSGVLSRLDHQGEPSNNGLPTFSAMITIPHITKDQALKIFVGMSVQVAISLDSEPALQIPLTAVIEKEGHTYVRRKGAPSSELIEITTGKTTASTIAVLSGLKEGEEIVIAH